MNKLMGRYELKDVKVKDPGLQRYTSLETIGLHSAGRHRKRFGKTRVNIIERLINSMMRTEHVSGKKFKAYKVVKKAFAYIEKQTKKNPVQVFVDALAQAGPREETTRLVYGGISVLKAVDISSLRRLDISLRNIAVGAFRRSHCNRKSLASCLAEEIIRTSQGDTGTYAVSKKHEMERIAESAR